MGLFRSHSDKMPHDIDCHGVDEEKAEVCFEENAAQSETTAEAVHPSEKSALRKFDLILMPGLFLVALLGFLDRTNIGNAKIFGLEEGLGLHGTQFNDISTMFYPLYILMDIPWVIAVKRFGVNRVLAFAMVGWTASTIGMGFCQTYAQAIGCRLVLGGFEAGLIPACVFIISTIYDRNSQAKRIAVIYIASGFSGAFGGLIAYSTQLGGDQHGIAAWRWLFIIEGAISAGAGILVFFGLPTSAQKAWFLNDEEKAAMSARAARNAAYRGEDQSFRWAYFKMALSDPFVLIAAVTLFSHSVALLGYGIFLPTIIRGLGYTALEANYLTIPVFIFAAIVFAVVAAVSDRFKKRLPLIVAMTFPGILGYAMIIGTANKAVGYLAMFLCVAGLGSFSVLFLTWISINLSPEYKRSIAIPFVLTITNCSGMVGSQIYITRDAPRYVMGNVVSMCCEIAALILVGALYLTLRRRNAAKNKSRMEGSTTNGKEGDKSLDFVYQM